LKLIELGQLKNVLDVSLADIFLTEKHRTNDWELVIVDLRKNELGEALFMEYVFTLFHRDHFVFSQQL
jgi:hypothetical protein